MKVGTLLFPGYNSERASLLFMLCEVGTFAAAGRISSVRRHASARLHPHTSSSGSGDFAAFPLTAKVPGKLADGCREWNPTFQSDSEVVSAAFAGRS